jgi:hypothetical protein
MHLQKTYIKIKKTHSSEIVDALRISEMTAQFCFTRISLSGLPYPNNNDKLYIM